MLAGTAGQAGLRRGSASLLLPWEGTQDGAEPKKHPPEKIPHQQQENDHHQQQNQQGGQQLLVQGVLLGGVWGWNKKWGISGTDCTKTVLQAPKILANYLPLLIKSITVTSHRQSSN